jgi:hypothetical protein
VEESFEVVLVTGPTAPPPPPAMVVPLLPPPPAIPAVLHTNAPVAAIVAPSAVVGAHTRSLQGACTHPAGMACSPCPYPGSFKLLVKKTVAYAQKKLAYRCPVGVVWGISANASQTVIASYVCQMRDHPLGSSPVTQLKDPYRFSLEFEAGCDRKFEGFGVR